MANELKEYERLLQRLNRVYSTLPNKAATLAVNFTKERFRDQNWVNTGTEPWKKRKYNKGSARRRTRKILVDKARLLRSIRKISVTDDSAVIGTDVPYAQIHNDGGRYQGAVNVPAHRRRAFTRTVEGRRERVRAAQVKSHSRKAHFNMPRRRFLGPSAVLDKRIERMMTAAINNVLK